MFSSHLVGLSLFPSRGRKPPDQLSQTFLSVQSWPKPIPLTGTETTGYDKYLTAGDIWVGWPKPIPLTGTETFLDDVNKKENNNRVGLSLFPSRGRKPQLLT